MTQTSRRQYVAVDGENGGDTALNSEPDREYSSRLDAQRVTLQFAQPSAKRLDSGKECIEDGPLFGGPRQGSLFQ